MKAITRVISEKPHLPLWVISALLLVLFFIHIIISPENNIDINIHDTYYVIASAHLLLLLSLWFGCCASGYMILKRFNITPNFWLVCLHLVISVTVLMGMFFPDWFVTEQGSYEVPSSPVNLSSSTLWNIKFLAILLFLIAQGLYFINVFVVTSRKVLFR